MEEELVFFLLQIVSPPHEVRSAFTRGSIRGWVYVEATMNEHLRRLLNHAPGVILKQSGIICQQIDFQDWVGMLTMRDHMKVQDIGKWVHVQKGVYKGDVGFVNSLEDWGVRLLLVPRLPPPRSTDVDLKRKRSLARPPPALFEPDIVYQTYGVDPVRIDEDEDMYSFKGHTFEYGLIIKSYDFHSISTPVSCIPISLFNLFRWSRHPKVVASESTFPRPSEWLFAEGDEVIVRPSGKRGFVIALSPTSAEVDLGPGGIVNASWLNVHKALCVGDYIEVTGGDFQGKTGWLDCVEDEVASVVRDGGNQEAPVSNIEVSQIPRSNVQILCSYIPQVFLVRIDLLKRVDVPFSFAAQAPSTRIPHSDPVPWIGTEVVITQPKHPFKGHRGTVKDVNCRQATSSGLVLQIELATFLSIAPFRVITLDYDAVVEARWVVFENRRYTAN